MKRIREREKTLMKTKTGKTQKRPVKENGQKNGCQIHFTYKSRICRQAIIRINIGYKKNKTAGANISTAKYMVSWTKKLDFMSELI